MDQFQIPAEEKGVTLIAALDRGEVMISADHTQIERLLSNLLSNAMKYTPEGRMGAGAGGPRTRTGSAQLVVEDTGVGIAAENLPHIFDRFYRVRNAQTNHDPGAGAGLEFRGLDRRSRTAGASMWRARKARVAIHGDSAAAGSSGGDTLPVTDLGTLERSA